MLRSRSLAWFALLFCTAQPLYALQASFEINGKTVEASLSRVSADRNEVYTQGEHYTGKLIGVDNSWVRASRIDGQWQGLISVDSELHVLEPANSPLQSQPKQSQPDSQIQNSRQQHQQAHALSALALPLSCGLDTLPQSSPSTLTLQQAVRNTVSAFDRLCEKAISGTCAVVELEMVFDQDFVKSYPSNHQVQAASLLNIVEGFYSESFGIRFDTLAVTYLAEKVFADDATSNGFLSEVALKKANNSLSFVNNPSAILHIVRGAPFTDEGTAGVAWLEGLCSEQGYSSGTSVLYRISQNSTPSIPITALITTHEIGHNLGAQHDNTSDADCPNGYLMDAIVNPMANEFSSCSKTAITTHLGNLSEWQQCTDYPVKLGISPDPANELVTANTDIQSQQVLSHRLFVDYQQGFATPSQATITLTFEGASANQVALDGTACRNNTDGSQWHCTYSRNASGTLAYELTPLWAQATVTATASFGNNADFYNIDPASGRYRYQITGPGPERPRALRATLSNAQILLEWEDASSDETGFEVQRRMNAGIWQTLATLPVNTQRYLDATAASADYEYRVLALGQTLSSTPSDVVSLNNSPILAEATNNSGGSGGGALAWTWLLAMAGLLTRRRQSFEP